MPPQITALGLAPSPKLSSIHNYNIPAWLLVQD